MTLNESNCPQQNSKYTYFRDPADNPFGNDDNDPNAEKNKEEFWNFNGDDGEEEKEEEEED
jgi:hypothetical protein